MAAKKEKKKPFGGITIKPDAKLGAIIGKAVTIPTKMTKALWGYFKRKKLLKKTATGPFGGMKVKPDAALKAIGVKGMVPPSKVFKIVWDYIKRHGLKKTPK